MEIASTGADPSLTERPRPTTPPGHVLLRVRACALNFADLLMARGEYQDQPEFPLVPGMELAGEVTALGPDVDARWLDCPVAAFTGMGGLAEYAAVPADRLIALGSGIPFDIAAAVPVAYGTSHLALSRVARLTPKETLLVLGAAGGVGLTAVELGRMMGARVIASARGVEKGKVAAAAGADLVLDSDADDLVEKVRDLGGADVVFDPVGGPGFADVLRVTRPEGRILLIGFASGSLPDIRANHLLVKNVSVHGVSWGGYLKFDPAAVTDSLRQIFAWLAEGRITPHVSQCLPLDRASEGFEMLRARSAMGKIVVTL